jgi:hypothetical protein
MNWGWSYAAPFHTMHGTSKPTVGFVNGLAFYNGLRWKGRKAVLRDVVAPRVASTRQPNSSRSFSLHPTFSNTFRPWRSRNHVVGNACTPAFVT